MDVAALQDALRDEGFDPGSTDGLLGPRTTTAAVRYAYAELVGDVREPTRWTWSTRMRDAGTFGDGRPVGICIHESACASGSSTIRTLLRRGLSVHLVVHRAGHVSQHVPLTHRAIHAGKTSNEHHLAVEVVSPYYPERGGDGPVVEAPWAHKGRYDVPEPVQLEATFAVIRRLCTDHSIPMVFPASDAENFYWQRAQHMEAASGIVAHARWHHADGLAVEAYCQARALGLSSRAAYGWMLGAASSGKRVTPLPRVAVG